MNALWVGGAGLAALGLGYRFYARVIDRRLITPSDQPTPAERLRDGVDYEPARPAVLFGHHFASIAGAGPIVGPLLGVLYFGWLPALIWVVLGSIFLGAVHDYTALMVSVRSEGRSLADVAEHVLGGRARWLFSAFLWVTLVLILAVFGLVTTATLVDRPEIVVPTFGLLVVAVAFGWAVNRRGVPVWLGTLLSLAALGVLIVLGEAWPLALPAEVAGLSDRQAWFVILMGYAFLASTLPVWLLLQPRDYLSTWILYVGLALGALGLALAQPTMAAPAVTGWTHEGQGMLWPLLFITIACGAISGFHSVVAGGTTAKQLSREGQGRVVGYGGMILEAVLALLVILIAAGALRWDPALTDHELGYQFLMNTKAGGPGPIGTFARGFGQVVGAIPGFTTTVGLYVGMLMLNTFVLTSLDTSARLARFILGEIAPRRAAWVGDRWVATLITVSAASALGLSGSYQRIWPLFGASNQLIAALALIVVTAWFVARGLPRRYTLLPALFMLLTTGAALVQQVGAALGGAGDPMLATIAGVLLVLAGVIAWEARGLLRGAPSPLP